jgi:hypothetical protein
MKDTEKKFYNRKVILAGFVCLLLIAGILAHISNRTFSTPQVTVRSQTPASDSRILGDTTASDRYDLTVNRYTRSVDNAPEGKYRLTIDVTLTNTSPEILQISPLLQMHVVDISSNTYDMTAEYLNNDPIGGPLKPGERFSGKIDFNVPVGSTARYFTFQLDSQSKIQTISL